MCKVAFKMWQCHWNQLKLTQSQQTKRYNWICAIVYSERIFIFSSKYIFAIWNKRNKRIFRPATSRLAFNNRVNYFCPAGFCVFFRLFSPFKAAAIVVFRDPSLPTNNLLTSQVKRERKNKKRIGATGGPHRRRQFVWPGWQSINKLFSWKLLPASKVESAGQRGFEPNNPNTICIRYI